MGKPLLTTGPPDQDAVSREPPRWAPTVVVVVVLAVVIAAPLTLRALSPGDHGRIGFFERVVYEEDLDGDDAVVAGMIAPEGWYWSDGSGEGSFHTGDGAVEVTSELIADVPDPSAALTERVPAGADLVPPEGPVSREDGMTQYSLEDPLGSSGGPRRTTWFARTLRNCPSTPKNHRTVRRIACTSESSSLPRTSTKPKPTASAPKWTT